MLRERDFCQVLAAVRDFNEPRSLEDFRFYAQQIASQLVECETRAFCELDVRTGRLSGMLQPLSPQENRRWLPVLNSHIHQNPTVPYLTTHPDSTTLRLADFTTQRAFRRTALYNEVYRHVAIEQQVLVGLKPHGPNAICITLHRARRAFSSRECALLDALRPHLMRAHANAVALSKMQDELDRHQSAWNLLPGGMMIVSPQGRLVFCNSSGNALLQTYFGPRKRQNALPEGIAQWLQVQKGVLLIPLAPLRIGRANRTLVARRLTHSAAEGENGVLVLLEEEVQHSPLERLKTLGLTTRQSEVLLLLTRGQTNDQIAVQLTMSRFTVKSHLEAIYDKLQVSSRHAAAQRAHQTLNLLHNSA